MSEKEKRRKLIKSIIDKYVRLQNKRGSAPVATPTTAPLSTKGSP